MCEAYHSDYDGEELCATVVVDTWNPAGVHMPTVFSTPQSILAAVDHLAIQFNKEVNLCATSCPRLVCRPCRLSVCACVSARSLIDVCLSCLTPIYYLAYAMARAPRWSLKGVCL